MLLKSAVAALRKSDPFGSLDCQHYLGWITALQTDTVAVAGGMGSWTDTREPLSFLWQVVGSHF